MLMRSGVTEIGEHTIAHVSGDETAALVNLLGTAVVIRADHLPQILRVKFCRERGRTDKITKHNRKLAVRLRLVPGVRGVLLPGAQRRPLAR